MIAGTACLAENDGPRAMQPGDASCRPAGAPIARHDVNGSAPPCTHLVVGTRLPSDRGHCAEIDKLYTRDNGRIRRRRRVGTPFD